MTKYFEFKKWLLEISDNEVSTNIIIHFKEKCIVNIRYGKLGKKYFFVETLDKRLINF